VLKVVKGCCVDNYQYPNLIFKLKKTYMNPETYILRKHRYEFGKTGMQGHKESGITEMQGVKNMSGFKPSSALSDPGRGQPTSLGPLRWSNWFTLRRSFKCI